MPYVIIGSGKGLLLSRYWGITWISGWSIAIGCLNYTLKGNFSYYIKAFSHKLQMKIMILKCQAFCPGPNGVNTIRIITCAFTCCWFFLPLSLPLKCVQPEQNGHRFAKGIFTCIFLERNVLYFNVNINEVSDLGSKWQCLSIGSFNSLAPKRQ